MPEDPLIGFTTGSVRFEQLLGRGAMGAVYRGTQLNLERPVAVKVINDELTEDPAYLGRFEREAQTLGRLVHPHIIACHDYGSHPGPNGQPLYLMVMEFVDGWSLGWLAKHKTLRVRQVLEFHRQAAEALAAAHGLGIIHRDIKPDNILVSRSGIAKLADFGLARQSSGDSHLTQAGSILGSPAYMAPEACRGEEPTAQSDLYSLGCSLLQVLSGFPAYQAATALGMMQMHIADPVPRLSDRRPDLAALEPLVARCLAKEPQARGSAKDLARAIDQLLPTISRGLLAGRQTVGGSTQIEGHETGTAERTTPTAPRLRASPPRSRHRRLQVRGRMLAATACVLVPLVLAISLFGHGPAPAAPPPASPEPAPAPATAPPAQEHALAAPTIPIDPDAADKDRLARAEASIHQGDLSQAEEILDHLVVAGALKQRQRALLERLAQAWQAQGVSIGHTLDAIAARIPTDPHGAAAQLSALDIPNHFDDLQERASTLLTHALATTAPHPDKVASPLVGDHQGQVLLLHDPEGRVTPLGDADLPVGVPGQGVQAPPVVVHRSVLRRSRGEELEVLDLPVPAGGNHDTVLLLLGARSARTLTATLQQAVNGQGSGPRMPVVIGRLAGGWEAIRVALPPVSGERRLVIACPASAGPLFVARAVVAINGVAGWADLHVVPGTLTPASGTVALRADPLRGHLDTFPRAEQIRISVPEVWATRRFMHRGLNVTLRHATGDAPLPEHPRFEAGSDVVFAQDPGPSLIPIDHAVATARRTPDVRVLLHVVDTAQPPTMTGLAAAERARAALQDHAHPLLIVLVLTADARTVALHAPWASFIRTYQDAAPGMPVIDLGILPLTEAAAGIQETAIRNDWFSLFAALEGGERELFARMRTR